MTAMNGKECQTSKVSRVAWEMMWTERQQHSWLRRLPLAAAAALPSTHPPVHRQADTNRQIQNSVINTSTCTQTDRYKTPLSTHPPVHRQTDTKLRYQHIHVSYTHTSTQILQLLQTSQSGTVQDLSGVSSSDTWKTSSISRQHRHWPSFAVASRLISSGAAFHDFTVLLSCPRSDMSLLTR